MHYEPDHHETDTERSDREHDERLEREDRRRDHAPLPDTEPYGGDAAAYVIDRVAVFGDAPFVSVVSSERFVVLPPDMPDKAREAVQRLGRDYASAEVDRLPPMGAFHWKVTAHRADGSVDVFRVGAHGSLMPWGAR